MERFHLPPRDIQTATNIFTISDSSAKRLKTEACIASDFNFHSDFLMGK